MLSREIAQGPGGMKFLPGPAQRLSGKMTLQYSGSSIFFEKSG